MAKIIILNENQFGEMMAYHGSGSDFDKFNHKKYLSSGFGSQCFGWGTYITNDVAVAKGYSDSAKQTIFDRSKVKKNDIYLKFLNDYHFDEKEAAKHTRKLWKLIKGGSDIDKAVITLGDIINAYDFPREERVMYEIYLTVLESLNLPKTDTYLYEVDIPDDNGHNYLSWYDNVDYSIFDTIQQKLKEFSTRFNLPKLNYRWNRLDRTSYDFKSLYRDVENRFDMCGVQGNKAASLLFMQCGFDGIKYPAGTRWQKPDGSSEDAMNYVIFDANKVKIVNKTIV